MKNFKDHRIAVRAVPRENLSAGYGVVLSFLPRRLALADLTQS